ncbi:MAG: PEP-CTERM sorting domain-containing protein [Verrucomicrobiota bacterium]
MQSSTLPKKPTLTTPLDSKLNRHFLACSAFVGSAVAITAQNADASIVYSGLMNLPVATTNGAGGIYIDFETSGSFFPTGSGTGAADGLNTVLPGWDVNFYGTSNGTGNLRVDYRTTYLSITGTVPNGSNHVKPLTFGTVIDATLLLGTYKTMVPEWVSQDAYIGMRFLDSSSAQRYGWVHLVTGAANGLPATVVDWAYENSGGGITAGAVPEPSTTALGCLAAGALGLSAWRKHKKS